MSGRYAARAACQAVAFGGQRIGAHRAGARIDDHGGAG